MFQIWNGTKKVQGIASRIKSRGKKESKKERKKERKKVRKKERKNKKVKERKKEREREKNMNEKNMNVKVNRKKETLKKWETNLTLCYPSICPGPYLLFDCFEQIRLLTTSRNGYFYCKCSYDILPQLSTFVGSNLI